MAQIEIPAWHRLDQTKCSNWLFYACQVQCIFTRMEKLIFMQRACQGGRMQRACEGGRQSVGRALPGTAVLPEQGLRLPRGQRPGELRAIGIGRGLLRARGSGVEDFLAAFGCLAIWGTLWLLMMLAVLLPAGKMVARAASSDRPRALNVLGYGSNASAGPADPALWCPEGTVNLGGACVLGEEIEVRPPPEWRRSARR